MLNDNDEERYVVTPKGLAWLAFCQCGIADKISESQFEGFWNLFISSMEKANYVTEGDAND